MQSPRPVGQRSFLVIRKERSRRSSRKQVAASRSRLQMCGSCRTASCSLTARLELRAIMGARARAAFEQRWDKEIGVDNWERLLTEVISSPP